MSKPHYTFTEKGRKIAERIVATIQSKGIPARVDVTYWDAGAGITWETIITESQGKATKGMEFQLLYPKDMEKMNKEELTDADIKEIISRLHP